MLIEDGKGRGYVAEVSEENNLMTEAIDVPFGHHTNNVHEEAYNIVVSKTPTGAGDCFLYVKNNCACNIFITSIKVYAAADEFVQIKLGDTGTPVGGSANTPRNLNAGSGHTADCTCEDGVNITGLTNGNVVDDLFQKGGNPVRKFSYDSALIIPKNSTITLWAVNGGTAVKVTLGMYFHS